MRVRCGLERTGGACGVRLGLAMLTLELGLEMGLGRLEMGLSWGQGV